MICVTHRDGVGGRGGWEGSTQGVVVSGTKRLGEGRVPRLELRFTSFVIFFYLVCQLKDTLILYLLRRLLLFRHDYSHRYHDSHRERPSFHSSDYSRTHDRPLDHSRSHDQHSRSYERSSDHHSRSYDKRDRRDEHHRSGPRDYSSESRYHSHRDRISDSTLRHGNLASSPKSSSTHESKRNEDRRSMETEREKR